MKNSIYAFVHIEKTAGTTLNHLLRRNFFCCYIDVRPIQRYSQGCFSSSDLRTYLKINPLLKCISGHSIYPSSDLSEEFNNIKYFTVLRNPIQRYLSQFNYLVSIGRIPDDFSLFLRNDSYDNFQVKKLSGEENLSKAKKIISKNMFEVGLLEEFDSFLLRLQAYFGPDQFSPYYSKKNITQNKRDDKSIIYLYGDIVHEKNFLDQQLYDYVKEEIIPERNDKIFNNNLPDLLIKFREKNKNTRTHLYNYVDYACRKFYYDPLIGLLRKGNQLPYAGSY